MHRFKFEDRSTYLLLRARDEQELARSTALTPSKPVVDNHARRELARSFAQEAGLRFDDTPARVSQLLRIRATRREAEKKAATAEAKRRRVEAARAIAAQVPSRAADFDGSLAAAEELLCADSKAKDAILDTLFKLRSVGAAGAREVRDIEKSAETVADAVSVPIFLTGAWLVLEVLVGTSADDGAVALIFGTLVLVSWINRWRPHRALSRLKRRAARLKNEAATPQESVVQSGWSVPDTVVHRCPIPGCEKKFAGSRRGWDAHVGSARTHPEWRPEVKDAADRKRLFREAFSDWFK